MSHFCTAAALLGTNLCDNDTPVTQVEMRFINHMAEEGLSYGTPEEYKFRLGLFDILDAKIEQMNANPENTFVVGHNFLSTWTDDEFSKILGAKDDEDIGEMLTGEVPEENLLSSTNWKSKMNPVQNQGGCGSCWAFAAAGTVEGRYNVQKGKKVKLSEQQLVDCAGSHDGCQGGSHKSAQSWIQSHGITRGSSYSYTGKYGKCKTNSGSVKVSSVFGISKSASQMRSAMAKGPIAVSVEATRNAFSQYKSGIINNFCGTKTDHAIVAVGYSGSDYWIVRNSWGAKWGESGHARIKMTSSGSGICGVQDHPSYSNF